MKNLMAIALFALVCASTVQAGLIFNRGYNRGYYTNGYSYRNGNCGGCGYVESSCGCGTRSCGGCC